MDKLSNFHLQSDCCACFTLVNTITKQVPRHTRYRGTLSW